MALEGTVGDPGECQDLPDLTVCPAYRGACGAGTASPGRRSGRLQRDPHGQWGAAGSGARTRLEASASLLSGGIYHGRAEAVFPRVSDRQISLDMLTSDIFGSQSPHAGQPRRHPDGSVSFGGHFAFGRSVDTRGRSGAMDPHRDATNSLARERNRFVHNSAMSALRVSGILQGVLDPDSGDAAGVLEGFADSSLEKSGVHPGRILCGRSTASRLLGGSGVPGDVPAALPGREDITITALPGMPDILHMLAPLDTLQHTDGGMVLGCEPTGTGYDLTLRGYASFATMNTCPGRATSATWSILPPEDGSELEDPKSALTHCSHQHAGSLCGLRRQATAAVIKAAPNLVAIIQAACRGAEG